MTSSAIEATLPHSDGRAPIAAPALWAGDDGLVARVQAWVADDPEAGARAELRALLERGAESESELAERFRGGLRFGTAGLRGALGAGPSRMNVATVRRASAGLAAYLLAAVPDAAGAGVVVGCDARHGSERFAQETALILSGAGLRVLRLPGRLPTPLVAFAVRDLRCAAGVMITASHNPPGDNGYKVFLGDGAQIAPPVDDEISAAIDRVGPLLEVPLGDVGELLDGSIVEQYLAAVISALPPFTSHDIATVYTPLHGVGRDVLLAAFAQAGFPPPHVVAAQAQPDPDFPTLPRPNPEEPGVLDLAIADAQALGAQLLIANDPDADRLAVAIPDDAAASGWRILRGDEIGALLGDFLLSAAPQPAKALVVTTVVSSSLLGRLARSAGAQYGETLTGFKWIMHDSAARSGGRFLFGYEEALGFAVNDIVRDKDGISAALLVAGIAAAAKQQARTIGDRLDRIARNCGLHLTDQFSLQLPGEAGSRRIAEIMAALRASPPALLLGQAVTEIDDISTGVRRFADGHEAALTLPRSDVLVWRVEERLRVVVRPSGTEPKLKVYLQVVVPAPELHDLAVARRSAAQDLTGLADDVRALLLRSEPVTR